MSVTGELPVKKFLDQREQEYQSPFEPRTIEEIDSEILSYRRQQNKKLLRWCVALTIIIGVPLVVLTMQQAGLTDKQKQTCEHTIC